ncbi:MAG: general secretion pathway protein A [Parasphingorhabdus sp.]|jgi:general secretion pathway protein A
MYESYFGFTELPFSIAPNPRFLYMSANHREAMAHLLYGIREGGGFVQLTGEVGTGKTTLCRHLLSELPEKVEVALILNPRIDELELMQSVCDELRISFEKQATIKNMLDALNEYLLLAHAAGKHIVLIIDEAQNLSSGVLEQVRLLTNLETSQKKLLQIILIGQTELKETLAAKNLRQLAQRVTARYHLRPLDRKDLKEYIEYRLQQSGCERQLFTNKAIKEIFRISAGVPRIVNVLADRALLGAYAKEQRQISATIVRAAGREVTGELPPKNTNRFVIAALFLLLMPLLVYKLGLMPDKVVQVVEKYVPVWMNRWIYPIDFVQKGLILVSSNAYAASNDLILSPAVTGAKQSITGIFPVRQLDFVVADLPQLSADQFQNMLVDLDSEFIGRVAALRQLTRLWNLPESIVFDCVSVQELGLSCFKVEGGWERLKVYNRPVVAEIEQTGKSLGYVVIESLVQDVAVVRINNQRYQISQTEFNRLWRGSALLLWQFPPLAKEKIDADSPPEDILWLRRSLNLISTNYGGDFLPDVEQAEFSASLIELLREFQFRNSLNVRDRVALEELVLIDSVLSGHDSPLLVY